jgi:hypothetical protein
MENNKIPERYIDKIAVPVVVALLIGGTSPWWFKYIINKDPQEETMTCIPGFEAVLDDHLNSKSGYHLRLMLNDMMVYDDSSVGYLEHGAPYKGPFVNWEVRELDKVRIPSDSDIQFKFELHDTDKSDWVGVRRVFLKCANRKVYETLVDDRKSGNLYGPGKTPVGIINSGQTRIWSVATR